MEASSIVLMEKVNGILDRELGSYEIKKGLEYVVKAFVEKGTTVIELSTDHDVDDDEYSKLFEEYNVPELEALGVSIVEDDEEYNPVWQMQFGFIDDHDKMTELLNTIIVSHMKTIEEIIG